MLHKRSFKPAKCKTALNLAKSRIKLMKNKKDIQLKQLKREVAQLLESGQDQTARIRVEHVVREEKTIAAYEMIEIYCELAVARLPIIESQKNCPLDLKEAIASLIFAAPRCGDIVELQDIRKHFTAKYGKEFASAAIDVRPDCGVSRLLVEKLSVKAPDGPTKVKILTAIAEEHNIKWEPNWFKEEDAAPSVYMPVAAALPLEGNKIQMQPLNIEIADDLEDKRAVGTARPGTSSQSHTHTISDLVSSSSTSHLESRSSESLSQKLGFSQSSGTEESAYAAGRQRWNMEFKDATAAAQAAAESAELASMAARAAAELSSRSNVKSDYSSGPGFPSLHGLSEQHRGNAGSGLQHSHMHRNSISGSLNQRSPRIQNHEDANSQGNMTMGGDATNLNRYQAQHEVQFETGKQDFTESRNSRRQSGDHDSSPIASKAEPNMFEQDLRESRNSRRQSGDHDSSPIASKADPDMSRSPGFQEYENESSENPFHEETVDRKNQPSNFHSISGTVVDEYDVFAKSNYDKYRSNSGDGSLASFSRNTADEEDWHVKSSYMYDEEDMAFKNHKEGNRILESDERYGLDSGSDIFVGKDRKTSAIDEKSIRTNAEALFDESGSDDDDVLVLNPEEEGNFPSPDKSMHKGFSVNEDRPHYEPDLSKSFKNSSIYSKLIEPMPVTFDDSDGASSGSEKEQQSERTDSGIYSNDYRESDKDRRLENMRSSYVEKGTVDSFMSSEHMEENQNIYSRPVSTNRSGFDSSNASQWSSVAVSNDFKSQSNHGLLDKGGPQKSFQSLKHAELHPASESEYQNQPRIGGGMELNLEALPGGRRNRAHLRREKGGLADASSPSRSATAASSDTFGSREKASTSDYRQAPTKLGAIHTHFDSPDDNAEVSITPKSSNNAVGPYRSTIDGNVRKTSPRDPTGYFDSDDSSSDEDLPKPAVSKNVVDAGLSRRTKGSAPRLVGSSRTSAAAAATTGRSPSSYTSGVSSSGIADQTNSDDEATFGQNLDRKTSQSDQNVYSSGAEKPMSAKSHDFPEASITKEKAPSRENSINNPSHVHPKLPDFEKITAQLLSLRKNRK
ncbi:hypothetical protein BVRB_004750 isoform B [Beta vulgaris subsp. vulgaris]|uniref:IST1-like protein n=1 Tax=Beta vulgaris subsp. vulgaris TaxID=3555 RepID=A0A0J8B3S5_BETVV|nr:uncharacterized protein LOC104883949 isoform X2 [Beta vulgaris subsp. vulgaris]KMS95819.1 hypothetical protein BVRB_004750 isoform B [Beta vulgaris subsp. vulgaris]